MKLTTEETDRAAQHLYVAAIGKEWAQLEDKQKVGYRLIVANLAEALDVPHSPEAVEVFMVWMGKLPRQATVR